MPGSVIFRPVRQKYSAFVPIRRPFEVGTSPLSGEHIARGVALAMHERSSRTLTRYGDREEPASGVAPKGRTDEKLLINHVY